MLQKLQKEKDQIFDALATNDVSHVVMSFSGGSDEGGADGWKFYDASGHFEINPPASLLADNKNILEDMEEILLVYFHFFDNQPAAWGAVEWNVSTRKVTLRADQEVITITNFTEEL